MTGRTQITKAMVLGAGMGKRMRDLTADRPKPMVKVGDKALVDHVLDRLGKAGVTDAVVNVHYKADVLEGHLRSRTTMPRITISDERDLLLDTGGGVVRALPQLDDAGFFIHNSDSIWRETGAPGLEALQAAWDPLRMDTILLLANPATTVGYDGQGDFVLEPDTRLSRRGDRVENAYVFAGVSIAQGAFFADAPDGAFSLNLLWDRSIAKGRVYGVVLDGQWMHVGTPEAVCEAAAAMSGKA